MKLTVFGATGGTGRQVVRQALDAGHEVTAVVRDPARLPIEHDALSVHTADVTDPSSLRPALEGQDAALSALAASRKQGNIATVAARSAGAAMESVGVRRIVAVSAVPVGPAARGDLLFTRRVVHPLLQRILRDVYADLVRMEAELRAADAEWTVVRPPRLLDKPFTGRYRREFGGGVPRHHTISRADLAHAMLAMLDDRSTVRRVVGVAS